MFGAFTKPIPPKSLNCRRPAPIEPVGTANFLFGYVTITLPLIQTAKTD